MSFKCHRESCSHPSCPWFSHLAGSTFVWGLGCLHFPIPHPIVCLCLLYLLRPIFLKDLAPTSPQRCPLFQEISTFLEAAEAWSRRPRGDILSHLIFIYIWVLIAFFPFLKHCTSPFLFHRKGHFISHSECFPAALSPQKFQRALVTCWVCSRWVICWPCCHLLPFNLPHFSLSRLRP